MGISSDEKFLLGFVIVLIFILGGLVYIGSTISGEPESTNTYPNRYGVMVTDDYETELIFKDGYELIGTADRDNFVCKTPDNRYVYCEPELKRISEKER